MPIFGGGAAAKVKVHLITLCKAIVIFRCISIPRYLFEIRFMGQSCSGSLILRWRITPLLLSGLNQLNAGECPFGEYDDSC